VTTLSYLELLGTLGHELRRPLTVVRGAATMLLSSPDIPEASRVQMLELIDRSAVAMSDLIEDLITVCHLEAGDLVVDAEQLEVAQIVDPVVEGARLQAGQQPRPILVLGSNPGLAVHADAEHRAFGREERNFVEPVVGETPAHARRRRSQVMSFEITRASTGT